jgi:hypothetical protein
MKNLHVVLGTALLAAAVAPAVSIAAFRGTSQLDEAQGIENSVPVIGWTFYDVDFLSCRTPASTFRHLAKELGPHVRLIAYGINIDEQRARSFLRKERLDIELITTTPEQYRARYGRNPKTGIHVARRGKIVQEFDAGPSHLYPTARALLSAVQAWVPAAASRSPAQSPPPLSPRRQS